MDSSFSIEFQSSLVQLLLGELPIKSGSVSINGSVSYAAQKPWLFHGTVRSNILFGQIYDKKRYNEVSHALNFEINNRIFILTSKITFDF